MRAKKRPVRAFMMIHVRAGRAKAVAQELAGLDGVKLVHACWGVPDVIAYVEMDGDRELDDLVSGRVAQIEGVERTDTHIALD